MSIGAGSSRESRAGSSQLDPRELARKGIKWREFGLTPEDGLDCWGAVKLAGRYYGYDFPDFEQWLGAAAQTLADGKDRFEEKFDKVEDPEAGDIVLFSLTGQIDHIGIMIGKRYFFHSYRRAGVCISRLSKMYKARVKGYYRWRKP